MSRKGPSGRLVKNVTDKRGVKGGPLGPISKNVTDERGANDALIVRFNLIL